MKKVIHFSKFFVPAVILSVALIAFGVVGLFVKGINFGIDFKPGLIEDVAVVPTAIELTYEGSASVSVETSKSIVKSGFNPFTAISFNFFSSSISCSLPYPW